MQLIKGCITNQRVIDHILLRSRWGGSMGIGIENQQGTYQYGPDFSILFTLEESYDNANKATNNVLNSFVEQESQLQAQTRPTTSQGIAVAKDVFEKPNLAASNPGIGNILDSMFEVPDSAKDILENALPPKETKLKPPPPEEKEPERASNSNDALKPKPVRS